MHFDLSDTIAAIASAAGGAARGIIRISGPDAVAVVQKCFFARDAVDIVRLRSPQRIVGELDLGALLGHVSCDLYLWPTSRSYTRQSSVELHTFGSPPILNAALKKVCEQGARLAGPGEFTLRAFLAGRLDLTQAEAVLGVIDAGSRQELEVALAQLAGGLQGPLHAIRNELLDLLAHLEAGLDFVEEDIEFITAAELDAALRKIEAQLSRLAEQMHARDTPSHEYRVALVGRPNVGKSSLLNALAGEEAAIVSEIAGTTRDYVTRRLSLDGVSCVLIDTAGLDAAIALLDSPDAIGQSRSQSVAAQAHLVVWCDDSEAFGNNVDSSLTQIPEERRIRVRTKIDLLKDNAGNCVDIGISSVSGAGLEELRRAIASRLKSLAATDSQIVAGTAIRCRDSVSLATESVTQARHIAQHSRGEELVAAELRLALDELGRVTGAVYTDDVLDRIFSRFCIGK